MSKRTQIPLPLLLLSLRLTGATKRSLPITAICPVTDVRGGGLFGKPSDDEWEYYTLDDGDGAANEYDDEYEYYEESYGKIHYLNGEFVSDSDADGSGGAGTEWGIEADEYEQEEAESEQSITTLTDDEEKESISLSNSSDEFAEKSTESPQSRFWFTRSKMAAISQSNDSSGNAELNSPVSTDATKSSKKETATNKIKSWTKQHKQKSDHKIKITTSSKTTPHSSSGASFIFPQSISNKISSIVRDVSSSSIHSRVTVRGRNLVTATLASFSQSMAAIINSILLSIRSIANATTVFVYKYISIVMEFLRHSFDVLWNGPVEGVTTTGISRVGGLSKYMNALMAPSSLAVVISTSLLVLGIVILVRRDVLDGGEGGDNRFFSWLKRIRRREVQDSDFHSYENDGREDEFYYSDNDSSERSSDLQYLDSFDPHLKNTLQKRKRIALWPFRRTITPKTSPSARQQPYRSIQKWWRQKQNRPTATIIEPQHQPQTPPLLSQQVARLKSQLAQSEQERAVLMSDVQRLQHRLEKAQRDAREIISKNAWLEKQQSKADKILANAIEIERRQANSELERVRESMKDVLERERMLMRGRLADSLSSSKRWPRKEEEDRARSIMDSIGDEKDFLQDKLSLGGITIDNADEYDEDQDSIWGRHPRPFVVSNSSSNLRSNEY